MVDKFYGEKKKDNRKKFIFHLLEVIIEYSYREEIANTVKKWQISTIQ